MNAVDYLRFAGALLIVLGLILGAAWLFKRMAGAGSGRPLFGGKTRRLSIAENLPIDASRRLLLVRRDDTEHLILLGQDRATVVETGITAPVAQVVINNKANGTERPQTGEPRTLRVVDDAAAEPPTDAAPPSPAPQEKPGP